MSYNPVLPTGFPGESMKIGNLPDAYDFFRLGFTGRQLTDPNPVPMIMKRCTQEEKKDLDLAVHKIREYIDEEYGEEGLGSKWEKMAQGVKSPLFSVFWSFYFAKL